MILFSNVTPLHGVKVKLFNRGKAPQPKPLSKSDFRRLANAKGEVVDGRWSSVFNGFAYVVTVEAE